MKKTSGFILFLFFSILIFGGYFFTVRAAGCPLTVGKPYKTNQSSSVYYISPDCQKRPIRNPEVFFSHFSSWKEVKVTTKSNLQRIPNNELSFLQLGPKKKYVNGTVIKTATDPRVYVLSDSQIYPIESEEAFTGIGLQWNWIEVVEPEVLHKFAVKPAVATADDIPTHLLFKYPDSPNVYAIDHDSAGNPVKRLVQSYNELIQYYRPDRIVTLPEDRTFTDSAAFEPLKALASDAINAGFTVAPSTSGVTNTSTLNTNTSSTTPAKTQTASSTPVVIQTPSQSISVGGGGSSGSGSNASLGTVNMSLAMVTNVTSTTPSTTILYSLSYRNYGSGTATGVTLAEVVPANTLFSAASSTGSWSCTQNAPAGSTCTATIGTVEPGLTSTIIFATTATSSYEGSIINSASIADSGLRGDDTDNSNNTASTTVPVSGDPDVSLNVSMNTATTSVSSTVLYAMTYQNLGTIDAPGVILTATVPSGTIFYAASSTGSWSCADEAVAFSTCTSSVGVVPIGESHTKYFAVKDSYNLPYRVGWVTDALIPSVTMVSSTVTNTLSVSVATTYGADTNLNNNASAKSLFLATVPLTDMGTEITYKGFTGGLYANGSNTAPEAHRLAGLAAANAIQPLDLNGLPSATGTILMMSMGMSNTTQEFCTEQQSLVACNSWTFMGQASSSSLVNHTTLTILNGARGGQSAETWVSPTSTNMLDGSANNYDLTRTNRLTPSGLTEAQVQILWIKVTRQNSSTPEWRKFYALPDPNAEAYTLERYVGNIIRAAKTRYTNLKQVFLSSRVFGYDPSTNSITGEPGTYENGFSMKWLIQAQIDQMASGGSLIDPIAGDLNYNTTTSPWVDWGPYMWTNGSVARSDGLIWNLSDAESDHIHPSQSGETKVGQMLMTFFLNSEYTSWFRTQ